MGTSTVDGADAVVLYDYKSQNADELTIKVGDVLTELKQCEPGWMSGKLRSQVGLFPSNFVKIRYLSSIFDNNGINVLRLNRSSKERSSSSRLPEISPTPKAEDMNCKCQVNFAYTPQNADELELKVGEVIDVVSEVEDGWWKGSCRGKIGVFPSNFVVKLPCENQTIDSNNHTSVFTDRKCSMNALIPEKTESSGMGKSKEPHSWPTSHCVKSLITSESESAPKLPPKPVKEQCRVVFPYERQNEDELSLAVGDIVTIVSRDSEDKGWWRGELAGKYGVFPDNFVEILKQSDRQEPELPAKHGVSLSSDSNAPADCAGKGGEESASGEFDAVERASFRLSHITATRVKGPGRRPLQLLAMVEDPVVNGKKELPKPSVDVEQCLRGMQVHAAIQRFDHSGLCATKKEKLIDKCNDGMVRSSSAESPVAGSGLPSNSEQLGRSSTQAKFALRCEEVTGQAKYGSEEICSLREEFSRRISKCEEMLHTEVAARMALQSQVDRLLELIKSNNSTY